MDSLLVTYPNSLLVIRYHAYWPGGDDPFYLANTVENRARISYYPDDPIEGGWYVPRMFFDGIIDGQYYDDAWPGMVDARDDIGSPLEISLTSSYRKVKATMYASGPVPSASLTTKFVLTESHIDFAAPNGALVHDQVMRDMIPDAAGVQVTIQQGHSTVLTSAYALNPEWAAESCNMVVFVQDDATREVLQAAQCPVYDVFYDLFNLVESDGNGNGSPEAGETVNLTVSLENMGPQATGVFGKLSTDDPTLTLLTDHVQYDDLPAWSKRDNVSHPFVFRVADGTEPHYADFDLVVTLNDGADTVDVSFTMVIGLPDIMLVDDSGEEGRSRLLYKGALDASDDVSDDWSTIKRGTPDVSKLETYEIVVWFATGEGSTLSQEEQSQLASYLDGGGKLFLCGEDIAFNLQGSPWLSDYLHAQFVSDNSEDLVMAGVPGDMISGDVSMMSIGAEARVNVDPDVIAPLEGAVPFFHYFASGQQAAVRFAGDYKVVFFAFGFEGIGDFFNPDNSPDLQADIMKKVTDYLRLDFVPQIGDVNEDGKINIVDVVWVVNIILGINQPTAGQQWAADVNGDKMVNIVDAIVLVNIILGT